MVNKWYRGHDGKQKATDNFGIIWLADNPEYAQLYADEYGNEGVVSVFYIDESKLNCADTYYNDNFDVYDPDMREVKEYQKEGYNCYTFPVDMGDTDVLALFDESAIVKIEQYNSPIKLTESYLKQIIEESLKKFLFELDAKTYANAERKRRRQADELFKQGESEGAYKMLNKADALQSHATCQTIKNKHRK